ncbi:hypothetical protein BGZ68_010882 [Mortierella alpina]|nr:hypothetical protein BGZ68_010882 [Mortierella alpina]
MAFKIFVRHKEDLVNGIPACFKEETLMFPEGSVVIDKVVKFQGSIATPLAWLDDFSTLTNVQKSNYGRIVEKQYRIDSPLREGQTCSGHECGVVLSWRHVQLQTRGGTLTWNYGPTCCSCVAKAKSDRFERTVRNSYQIEGPLLPGLLEKLAPGASVPDYLPPRRCCQCNIEQDRSNTYLILGTSVTAPLIFRSVCMTCSTKRTVMARNVPMEWMKLWSKDHHQGQDFNSQEDALATVLTVAKQGFAVGTALYGPSEHVFLKAGLEEWTPKCFWTGVSLSFGPENHPVKKFTVDRTMFKNGKALPYGNEQQVLVSASEFTNCLFMERNVPERVEYLDSLEANWDKNIRWANTVISQLKATSVAGTSNQKWSPDWDRRWKSFNSSKRAIGREDRVQWSRDEWRHFVETCDGRSLVTGHRIHGKDANIDRIFNSDPYMIQNCLYMEQGLNFAKQRMPEFQSSATFDGECKLEYGVQILRKVIKDLLEQTKPRRASWERELQAYKTCRYPWKDGIPEEYRH